MGTRAPQLHAGEDDRARAVGLDDLTTGGQHPVRLGRIAFRSRANLRSQSRSAIGGYPVSVKAEPIEETKESGIILAPTGRGQRLNNCAAILRSEKRGGTGTIPAEESTAVACWSRWCGCRSRQPARDALGRAGGSRRAPRRRVVEGLNLTLGIRTAMAPVSMNVGPQNCGAVPGCLPTTRCGEDGRRLLRFSNGF